MEYTNAHDQEKVDMAEAAEDMDSIIGGRKVDLASLTPADATASDILIGKTAWVNGEEITGTFNPGAYTQLWALGASQANYQNGCSGSYKFTQNYDRILVSLSTSSWASTSYSFGGLSAATTFDTGGWGIGQVLYVFENVPTNTTFSFGHKKNVSASMAIFKFNNE